MVAVYGIFIFQNKKVEVKMLKKKPSTSAIVYYRFNKVHPIISLCSRSPIIIGIPIPRNNNGFRFQYLRIIMMT